MSKKWACRTYYNPNPFISFSWHDTIMMLPVPPFVIPTKAFHLNFSVVQGLWIGSFLSNGRGKKVVGDDLLFMGRTSDAGLFIPHISFPPNFMNILTTLFGSSTILFGTSSVTLACKNAIWGNDDCDLAATPFGPVPFSLNLACHDPYSFPTDIVIVWGSVYSGMSLGDFFAALIDFAINLACEFGMKHIAEPLAKKAGAGLKKVGGKIGAAFKKTATTVATTGSGALTTGVKSSAMAGTGAAAVNMNKNLVSKKASKTAAKKGVLDSIASNFKKLTGSESTDAMKSYVKKAATTRGMYDSLKEMCYSTGKHLDKDLVDLVEQGTPGVFSKEFLSELQNIKSSKYDEYVSKMMSKSKGSLKDAEESGSKKISKAVEEQFVNVTTDIDDNVITEVNSIMTKDIAIDSVMRTTFWTSMKEMNDAAEKASSTELARLMGYKALKKSFSQILWKYTIRNGGLIDIDWTKKVTIAGYSFNLGINYDSNVNRQFTEKWWSHTGLWDASDLGLTTSDDSDYWEEAYVEGDGSSDDYWYESSDDSSSSSSASSDSSASVSNDSEDDDYWYGTDNNANTTV